MTRTLVLLAGLLLVLPSAAQQSASYELTDSVFNAGAEQMLSSTSYSMTLVGIGETAAESSVGSASYEMDASFAATYPPAGEVQDLLLVDRNTLIWSAERSIGDYNLYRDLLSNLSALPYGSCLQQRILDETATDNQAPPAGDGYLYLITARNRLGEEGGRGFDSTGAPRPASDPCP